MPQTAQNLREKLRRRAERIAAQQLKKQAKNPAQSPVQNTDGLEIGARMEDGSVFAGTWTPKDRQGNSLGKTFNLFAAYNDAWEVPRENLCLTFNDAVQYTAALKDCHGHDGGFFDSDEALYEALDTGAYNGEWFIPTMDIAKNNLYANQETGDLKRFLPELYLTCTGVKVGQKDCIRVQSFHDGGPDKDGVIGKDDLGLSFRLVRAELRPS